MVKQYKVFLNILITLLLVLGIGIFGYLAYDYISKIILTKEAEAAVDEFLAYVENQTPIEENNPIIVDIDEQNNTEIQDTQVNNEVSNNTVNTAPAQNKTPSYKNFNVVGSIQIPKTKIKYPVVDVITPDAVAVAVTKIYGPGLNEVRKYSTCCT